MNTKEINNIINEILFTKLISIGTKGICFKRKDELIKIFYDYYFDNDEMIKYLHKLYKIGNDTYIVPNEILLKNDKIIGYKEPYIHAKTLNNIYGNINQIFNGFDKLIEDTKYISNKGLILKDLHNKNILFNNEYHIIDLDNCIIGNCSKINTFNINMNNIIESILQSIFKVELGTEFSFYNSDYTKLRNKKYTDYRYFYDLIDLLINNSKTEDIHLIKKRTWIKYSSNSYYYY